MNKLAKALYDNTAECADELAFRKGDIIMVMDENVAGTSGWWMCSLYGRQGLAPANRLQLLSHACSTGGSSCHAPDKQEVHQDNSAQNIYQIPSVPQKSRSQQYDTYIPMDMIYNVPSAPLTALKSPAAPEHTTERSDLHMVSGPPGQIYNIPGQGKRASLFKASTTPRQIHRKHSLVPITELEKRSDYPHGVGVSPGDSYTYTTPSAQDPNYDIPVPSATEAQQKMTGGYSTLPNPCKTEWIYDVPVAAEKQSTPQTVSDTKLSKALDRQFYGTCSPTSSLYDIPKPSDLLNPPKVPPRLSIYDKPLTQRITENFPKDEDPPLVVSDPASDHIPLECRRDSSVAHEHTRVRLHRVTRFLAHTSLRDFKGSGEVLVREDDEKGRSLRLSVDSQRISTASSSSTSSCDSLALSSSSPEPLRELTLSQDEASCRLLDLQESVCKAVPRLMEFVSSRWRSREHLEKHLEEIKGAAEEIACSVTCFLSFAMDVRGNTRRLTDANLQTRLCKQLSVVEDSGVILQQTVGALNMAGWPLDTLSQDPGQVQTPDQLERFVMVARTVPEDIKRLVSIINANSKLLFRASRKDPESFCHTSEGERQGNVVKEDNDYVELQTNEDFEKPEEEVQKEPKQTAPPSSSMAQSRAVESGCGTEQNRTASQSEHCRLYFGALQKAIWGFIGSLQDGQPPEKFISQSKLVIMVGQRLVNTLCREAQQAGSSQSLLGMSSHLCALLKQLAVATKKAALHFPDQQVLHEAQEFAKELSQRAQHFRTSLEL